MTVTILTGDCREVLKTLPSNSVQMVCTSPPYYNLRDYGISGQIGLEHTPEAYVDALVRVFREVRRVLRPDGTLWLNLGDSYAAGGGQAAQRLDELGARLGTGGGHKHSSALSGRAPTPTGYKPKDLLGIPWAVAFALRADGWHLRADIIWSKPNPMPESVTDRPTKAHEYLFLLSKSARYFYDADAIREPHTSLDHPGDIRRATVRPDQSESPLSTLQFSGRGSVYSANGRNRRSVWEIATAPFKESHFATMPPALVEPCIKAGTSERGGCPQCGAPWRRQIQREGRQEQKHWSGADRQNGCVAGGGHFGRTGMFVSEATTTGWRPTCRHDLEPVPQTVLDPFMGSGTTLMVASRLGRDAIGIDLNPNYVELASRRVKDDCPLFVEIAGD